MRKHNKEIVICIIGCGVSGLSCGIKLLEEGYTNIKIVAKDLPPNTVSDVAAAIWRPYRIMPEPLAISWALESLKTFEKLANDSQSGVCWLNLTEVYKLKRSKPEWMNAVKSAPTPYLPKQYTNAYSVCVPLIDTSIYMPYLFNKYIQLGGIISNQTIHDLSELASSLYIINCSGIGARQLMKDNCLFPIKGLLLRMTKPKELNYGIVDYEDEMTYIYPRYNDCIVGSTAEENQWELSYDKNAARNLLDRAIKLCPVIQSAEIIEHLVGLRPARKEVRLGVEPLSMKTTVIHNYGHGGRGFTLSWGCANEVSKLLNEYCTNE